MTTGLEVRVHEGRERAEVTRVTWTLNEVVSTLREIDRVYLLRATRPVWVLADMRRNEGDLIIRVEARRTPARRSAEDMLVPVDALVGGVAQLSHGPVLPPLFSTAAATKISALAAPAGGIQGVTLAPYNGSTGEPIEVSTTVGDNASTAVRPFEVTWGSITGHVSGVTERRRQQVGFTVVQDRTRQAVAGQASEEMAEQLRTVWRHRAVLGGKLRRNSRGQVIRIDVDRIQQLPEDNRRRPSTQELLGAAPDWADTEEADWLSEVRRG